MLVNNYTPRFRVIYRKLNQLVMRVMLSLGINILILNLTDSFLQTHEN